ncbi:ribosomal protein S5 family protein [Tanacetum coccineum]
MSKAILNRLTPAHSFAPLHPMQYAYTRLSKSWNGYQNWDFNRRFSSYFKGDHVVRNLLAEAEREKQRERDQRKRAEDDEDYMRVGPLIAKLEKENQKHVDPRILNMREEATDSESEEFTHEAIKERQEVLRKKLRRRDELLQNYTKSENIDDAFKWMHKIDKFEEKHLPLRPEYRVIGDLMNRLKEATGKDKFLLQHKINRAIRLMKWKEAYDPDNPANYGVIQKIERKNHVRDGDRDHAEDSDAERDRTLIKGASDDDDDEEFDVMKERDDLLTDKINAIDRKLEEKLIQLDYTFGKKGKELEEEIRDLAEERNSEIEKKKIPLFRKGFDVKLIDLHRTTKVTKGGRMVKFSVMVVCGNYHGVIGFAKAKDENISKACH